MKPSHRSDGWNGDEERVQSGAVTVARGIHAVDAAPQPPGDDRALTRSSTRSSLRFERDGLPTAIALALCDARVSHRLQLARTTLELAHARVRERENAYLKQRVRSLEHELLRVEERERLRLSMDVHDGLGQLIAALKLKLAVMGRTPGASADPSLLDLEQLVDEAHVASRALTFELCPRALNDLGLRAALEELVTNISGRYGVAIALEHDDESNEIDADTRKVLFRCVRELLINAAKHARANQILVRVERTANEIRAVVEDDGVGMPSACSAYATSGLFGVRERLGHVGGHMRIESQPGRGTRVCLSAPECAEPAERVEAVE